ncbi:MAG TPA: ribbon-helix-helix domain-containing protein, partial [Acidimicrobiia bacterium]|nr:ribbon-helix-helix domain-containing protein [Acidimicrobiia bacterium]
FVKSSYLGDTSTPSPEPAAVAARPRGRSRELMTELNVSLPPALLRGLEEKAERDGLDIEEFIRQALEKGERS